MIKEILTQLETSTNPVAKVLHKSEQLKVIIIAFKKGMILKEHKTSLPAKLTALKGQLTYKESDRSVFLGELDEVAIPVDVLHAVEAQEDSLCLLIQG